MNTTYTVKHIQKGPTLFIGGFIFGVIPLVFAKGAGSASLRSIGICTCAGMLVSTFVGIVFVPALYSLVERVRERVKGRSPVA